MRNYDMNLIINLHQNNISMKDTNLLIAFDTFVLELH